MKVELFGQPGTKVRLDGQEYELIRVGFYQNRKGDVNEHAFWRSICAEPECQDEFETFGPVGHLPQTRRCPKHRKPGTLVNPKRRLTSAQLGALKFRKWSETHREADDEAPAPRR